MKITNSFAADDLAICRAHSAIVAAPKRPVALVVERRRATVHAMCLAMSEVYQLVGPETVGPTIRDLIQSGHLPAPADAAKADGQLYLVLVAIEERAMCSTANPIGHVCFPFDSKDEAVRLAGMSRARGYDYRLCDKDGWIQAEDIHFVRPAGLKIQIREKCDGSICWRPSACAKSPAYAS